MATASASRLTDEFAERFASRFPARVARPRRVGREAEFPLVSPDGRACDASSLWPPLLEQGCRPIFDRPDSDGSRLLVGVEADRWSCVMEVGRGTIEIAVGPRDDLPSLDKDLRAALRSITPVVRRLGCRLLGYGIQPRTGPTAALMTPKPHYRALLRAIGPRWLRFAVTASDQLHIDVSREELVPMMNLLNSISGALVALSANSSVYGGRRGRYASGREGLMASTTRERYRHGAVPRPFTDVDDYVAWAAEFRCLCLPDGAGGFRFPGGPFTAEARRGRATFEDFLFHEHYLWPSARPRARLGTIEVRPACQQPAASSWAMAALTLGLSEAMPEAAGAVEDAVGPQGWDRLLQYRSGAARHGLRAPEPAPGFLDRLLDVAEAGLRRRGRAEERLLDLLRDRVAARRGPADLARDGFASGGIGSLLELVRLDDGERAGG